MAGRRYKDFRGGDLSEELGHLLLKGIAAVATVPRSEDIGIDAVATLLKLTDDDYLIAEDSFYVQFKSISLRRIKFEEHEVRWLEKLKLPYFIGSIRKRQSTIDLYAAHRLSQVLLENLYTEITALLDNETEVHETDKRSIYIGPPLLSWTTQDLSTSDFALLAYKVIKPYLTIEQRNIDYRSIRYFEVITWETGKPPTAQPNPVMYHSTSSGDIQSVFREMSPHLLAIVLNSSMKQDRRGLEIVLRLAEYMRESGADPDPFGMYQAIFDVMGQTSRM
jgi:hypothetical protein